MLIHVKMIKSVQILDMYDMKGIIWIILDAYIKRVKGFEK